MSRRNLRAIELDPPVTPWEEGSAEEFRSRKVIEGDDRVTVIERWRDGEFLYYRKTVDVEEATAYGPAQHRRLIEVRRPARVSFDWIADHYEVEDDSMLGAPWEEHDGWEHDCESFEHFQGERKDFRSRRGFVSWQGGDTCIMVTDKSFAGESRQQRYEYYRMKGASKQVAREKVAREDQLYIDQLTEWYSDGYDWWQTEVKVEIDGEVYGASCGGISGREYAETEMVQKLTYEVAHAMEADGFIITNWPDRTLDKHHWRAEDYKRKLNLFNWHD